MKIYLKAAFTCLLVLVANVSFAPPPAPGGGHSPSCWPTCIPIDNGLVFLIVAVGFYATVRLYNYQKKAKAKV